MNIELSKNNHLKWGYNQTLWNRRQSVYDKFFIGYGKVSRRPKDFRQECINTACEISDAARSVNKQPLIFYSGGVDSESMIISFLLSRRDFSVCHIRFEPNFNDHETAYVKKFCEKYQIDLLEYSVNTLDFLTDPQTFVLAVRDNVSMIEVYPLTAITNQIKDRFYPVLDHPGTFIYREEPDLSKPSKWTWKDYECIMFYYNHARNENMPACPSFFHWSPEMISAFLLDTSTRDLVSGKSYGKITNRTSSILLYQNAFPEFEIEPRPKYTGFECIPKNILHDINSKLRRLTLHDIYSGQEHEYHELLRMLGNDD